MNDLPISEDSLQVLKQLEGFSAKPYFDFKGYSVGYGHLIKPSENHLMNGVTKEEGEQLLISDVFIAAGLLRHRLTNWDNFCQGRKDACIIMCFNVPMAFTSGSIDDKINANAPIDVIEHTWLSYNKVRVNETLVSDPALSHRRGVEWKLYLS